MKNFSQKILFLYSLEARVVFPLGIRARTALVFTGLVEATFAGEGLVRGVVTGVLAGETWRVGEAFRGLIPLVFLLAGERLGLLDGDFLVAFLAGDGERVFFEFFFAGEARFLVAFFAGERLRLLDGERLFLDEERFFAEEERFRLLLRLLDGDRLFLEERVFRVVRFLVAGIVASVAAWRRASKSTLYPVSSTRRATACIDCLRYFSLTST